jgi:hypothetical protein
MKPTKAQVQTAIGKVVQFVRANPLSTAAEIYKGCGVGVTLARKYVKQKKYNGQWVYRLNHQKLGTNLGNSAQ